MIVLSCHSESAGRRICLIAKIDPSIVPAEGGVSLRMTLLPLDDNICPRARGDYFSFVVERPFQGRIARLKASRYEKTFSFPREEKGELQSFIFHFPFSFFRNNPAMPLPLIPL